MLILDIAMQICLSTQFGHAGDAYGGRLPALHTGVPVRDSDIGIAHRTWPMGSKVFIRNLRTKKTSYATVIARGPYGKNTKTGKWFNGSPGARKKRKKKGLPEPQGKWRGCADLTPSLAKRLQHNGKDRIQLQLIRKGKKK